jgi:hypothetical protein
LRHRRPISGQADLAGEPRVSSRVIPPPSLLSVKPCSAAGVAGRRAMLAEGRPYPARGQPGSDRWASGPTSQGPWVNRPRCKKSLCALFQFYKFQEITESCKIRIIFILSQKNVNDLSKYSEKYNLPSSIKSMHIYATLNLVYNRRTNWTLYSVMEIIQMLLCLCI